MNPETNNIPGDPHGGGADCVALIVAAGRGERAGGESPKQYQELDGSAMIRRSTRVFLDHARVGAVRAVIHGEDRELYEAACQGLAVLDPVIGGATRQDSVRLGLESLAGLAPGQVLIHDAARPLLAPAIIDRVIDALANFAGAIPALEVSDTLKRGEHGRVTATVERAGLWRAQTPQGFRFAEILRAHADFAGERLTDDAAVAEAAGLAVAMIAGDEDNLKVTTPEDMARAKRLIGAAGGEPRVGTGFDVHRFTEGDQVILCAVPIPHDRGLAGHSDADVALHALTDAILGAIGDGDIGLHFPPGEEQWLDAPSETFLRFAGERVAGAGGQIVNLDLTLICESPRIAPYRDQMRDAIGRILGLDRGRISVKGTTTEGLGFTGRGEGIAAQAVASIRLT